MSLEPTHPSRPELFFGLVSAIGTDLDLVATLLREVLSDVNYDCKSVRLSKILEDMKLQGDVPSSPVEDRYNSLMDAGTHLRTHTQRGDALAVLSIQYLRERIRKPQTGSSYQPLSNTAYILQSLKHPAEVGTLRDIYRSGFILIGAYAPRSQRKEKLAQNIANSRYSEITAEHYQSAEALIAKDEKETGNKKFGQNVQDTFPLADMFIDVSRPRKEIKESLFRAVSILFGYPYHTPTRDEYGMFHAYAAALRSSALGRQVGAVITSPAGEVLALGTNEVPKPGGGQYWEDDQPDYRDFQRGVDSSDQIKLRNLAEIIQRLKQEKWLSSDIKDLELDELVSNAEGILKGTRLMSPIEFGRAVHAEMSAFMDAGRRGVSVHGSTLYTTTFPCHNCAMHIVAAGVNRVVFIEPYPKSLATELFPESIALDGRHHPDTNKVSFEPFVGVAPTRYLTSFSMPERKSSRGEVISWDKSCAWPRAVPPFLSYLEGEDEYTVELHQAFEQLSLDV